VLLDGEVVFILLRLLEVDVVSLTNIVMFVLAEIPINI